MKFTNKSLFGLIVILFLFGSGCDSVVSEKFYCEEQAKKYFLLCMVNISVSPSYFGVEEWKTDEVQNYARGYCLAEYRRQMRCPGKQSYIPHRKE